MRTVAVTLLMVILLASLAFAEEGKKAEVKAVKKAEVGAVTVSPANNVVKMTKDGARTALCCCNAEFTVTDRAPTMDHGGTSFYMCGDGCKEMAMKASKEETEKMMSAWQKKYATYDLSTNTFSKDGKSWAKCGCGKEFEVMATSPAVQENGTKLYCCSEACHTHYMSMAAGDRMKEEQKLITATSPAGDTKAATRPKGAAK